MTNPPLRKHGKTSKDVFVREHFGEIDDEAGCDDENGSPCGSHITERQRDLVHQGCIGKRQRDEKSERQLHASQEFVPEEITIQPVTGQTYAVNAKGISTCYWRITGGFILSTNKGTVRAVWLPNASERKLECVGRLENGAGFSAEYVY